MYKFIFTISILFLTFTGTVFATTATIPYDTTGYKVSGATPDIPNGTLGTYYLTCPNPDPNSPSDLSDGGATWTATETNGWYDGHSSRGLYDTYTFQFKTDSTWTDLATCGASISVMYDGQTPSPTPTPTASPTPTPTISITTPTGTVDNFGTWAGSCYAYGSDYGNIAVAYGNNDPATTTLSSWDYTEYSSTKGNCAGTEPYWNLQRTNELSLATTTTWYAMAIYYKPICTGTFPNQTCTNDVYAYGTTTWNFMTNASTTMVYTDPVSDWSLPTSIERSKIEIYTDIENKFPFAYFYDLRNIFFQARTFSTDQFPTYTINMSSSSLPITANLFSSSTLTQFMGSTTFNVLKALFSASLWLGLGYYVYQRIKNLQL